MFYKVQCSNCHQQLLFDALHSKMECTHCHTVLTLQTPEHNEETLIQELHVAYKHYHFLRVEQLADIYLSLNPTNGRIYTYKAASMLFNQMHFTKELLEQSFDYFETGYTLATDEAERLFTVEQMNTTICALYLHHLKLVSQYRDLETLPQIEELYNQIAGLQFNDQSLRYLFLLQLAQAHDMIARDLNRAYIRCTNAYHANTKRSHQETKEFVKDLLFFSVIAKFIAKRAEILNQLSAVHLDDALIILYDLLIHRYNEELHLSYYIAAESFSGTDYHEVKVELDPATTQKLRAYKESYSLLKTKVGLKASG